MNNDLRAILRNPFFWVVFITILIRLFTIGEYPLADTTEARYSEMARIMVETNNWLTPQFDYNIPFWGKPPLSIWVSAASFKLFGVSEFSARLPSIFIALAILYLVFYIAKQQRDDRIAWIATAFLSTNMLFFILSGAVLMDTMMALGITLAMISFWQAMNQRGKKWGYLFFTGLSIGLMSKGPVAIVLTGIPIVPWLIISGQWRYLIQRIPLVRGTFLMLVLSVPWYILAEQSTPGFLNYFLIGEHWKRFTVPGWSGDLYGTAHTSKVGAIWINWLIVAFPMSFILLNATLFAFWRKKLNAIYALKDSWFLYLLLWLLTPMLFFTLSGNILATYVLPGIPAIALLVAGFCQPQSKNIYPDLFARLNLIPKFAIAGILIPLIYLWLVFFYLPPVVDKYSEKSLVSEFNKIDATGSGEILYYQDRPFSARFYTKGHAELIKHENKIWSKMNSDQLLFLAVPKNTDNKLSDNLKSCMKLMKKFKRYYLYQIHKNKCHSS